MGFLRNLGSMLCFAILLAGGTTAAERPNVVIIYTDDQGFGDASCLNSQSKFETPNLDRIASEGITFVDAHCSDTVCTPSRYGLLTGRYSWRTRLKKGVMGAEGTCLISEGRLTLPSMLKEVGYATAMVGKWHLGMDFPGEGYQDRDWSQPVREMPLDRGFDYFFGVPASLNYGVLAWFEGRFAKTPPTVFTNKKTNQRHVDYRIKPPYQASPSETKKLLGKNGIEVAPDFIDNQCLTRFTDKAIAWMKQHRVNSPEQPFLLYLPFTSPHYPVCPLPEFYGQGSAGGYGEFMVETDFHVGEILSYLDESEIADNTLVIFTSDNGPEKSWKERAKRFHHHSNGPYREGKRSIYEGGHRVPFFVRWPSGIKDPGRRSHQLVCQTDILATVADIVGFKLQSSAAEDSFSFLNELRSSPSTSKQARPPLIHHSSGGGFAIRNGKWKLVMEFKGQKRELFNLELDPSEKTNILKDNHSVAGNLMAQLSQIVTHGRSTIGEPQQNDTGYWPELSWLSQAEYESAVKSAFHPTNSD